MKRSSLWFAAIGILGLSSLWVMGDGGAPAPPWPPSATLIADGGAPAPPWPKTTLLADGGAPAPPWPPFASVA